MIETWVVSPGASEREYLIKGALSGRSIVKIQDNNPERALGLARLIAAAPVLLLSCELGHQSGFLSSVAQHLREQNFTISAASLESKIAKEQAALDAASASDHRILSTEG